MAVSNVPLNRTFSPVPHDVATSEEEAFAMHWGLTNPKCWSDLEREYRVIILADAGAGKTFETRGRAARAVEEGRTAFFIRIEDLDDNFENAFEVGGESQFNEWVESSGEAWFFLDSVDEARLDNPMAFEKAIRCFAKRVKQASHRAHVYITSRPYAWRFKADRNLIDRLLPFAPFQSELDDNGDCYQPDTTDDLPETALQLYALRPLCLDDIRQFAQHRSTPNIDQLITDIQRANLIGMAERPFDLEGLLAKWKIDGKLGSRLELLQHNVESRLDEIDPGRKFRQPINQEKARKGAQLLAAAVTLTGEAGILVPDISHEKAGIDAEQVLVNWKPNDVRALLERGIFNDVIYGAVRFRHRDIRELLTAEWLRSMLQKGNSRRKVESLIFREQYGEQIITPRLRPILPWLILFDDQIRQRALALHPEIAVEGGDASYLPFPERKKILDDIVVRIVNNEDDRSARDNNAIARIAQLDLSRETQRLIKAHAECDDAIFFLGRLVWQGNMKDCLDALFPIAIDPARNIYARMASIRAILTVGTDEQEKALWRAINNEPDVLPRRLLAELVENTSISALSMDLLLELIDKLPQYNQFETSGLGQALHALINRIPIKAEGEDQLLAELVAGFNHFLEREPHLERRECRVSKDFIWMMGPASHAVERLISGRSKESFSDPSLAILLKLPALRFWHGEDFEEHKNKLHELVPNWTELNDRLFWKSVVEARAELLPDEKRITDEWQVRRLGHYWSFDSDSFNRVLEFIESREFEDDKLVALSLTSRIFKQPEKPAELKNALYKAVEGNSTLEEALEQLLNPIVSEEQKDWGKKDAEFKRRREKERIDRTRNKALWIEKLRANPEIVRNPPGLEPGEFSTDQYWLLRELDGSGLRDTSGKSAGWRSLIGEFGEDVAHSFRDAAIAHWRVYKPGLRSEGDDTNSIPYLLSFAMLGLEIEAHEEATFPSNLTQPEVTNALRYIIWELNGFPSWLEVLYKAYPELVKTSIWKELRWELENSLPDQPMHYILHDFNYYAPWLHSALTSLLLRWIEANPLPNQNCLRYSLHILSNGGVDHRKLAELALSKISAGEPEEYLPNWYAIWVDVEPCAGIPETEAWLDRMDAETATMTAQHFITALMGWRHGGGGGTIVKNFQTAPHLKTLYLLMHKHIRIEEDIDRADQEDSTFQLRDNAQDARNQLFNILSDIPGKETYIALTELARDLSSDEYRSWMVKHARTRAEQDADLEFWTSKQVSDFALTLEKKPTSHRQLFDIGVLHIMDFREWLERGNDSLANTYQKIEDETEMRKVVANWLNMHAHESYTCAQENPLANNQRPDVWLQHPEVESPVPIELKLLDKRWSGPNLCERLCNQLAGDYLREETAGCGIYLLIWQGSKPGRRWEIDRTRVDITGLRDALVDYWGRISFQFPNVSAIEIIVIDLTQRDEISDR